MKSFTQLRMNACYMALALVLVSIFGLAIKGLNLGLDFTGGQLVEFSTEAPIKHSIMERTLSNMDFSEVRVTASSDKQRWTIRLQDIPDQSIDLRLLSQQLGVDVHALDSVYIGSQVGLSKLCLLTLALI